ncbi:MAG: hypothetical protein KAT76_05175 [Bacteroidales bacterium]|nr:hypothetical protein [Bacteroidales bacterium]
MKKLVYILAILFLFTSCDQVVFPEPQPRKVKELKEVPADLQGIFLDKEGDSLFVYEHSFSYYSDEFTSLQNIYLSDSAVLKKYRDRYFYSSRIMLNQEYYWLCYILHPFDDGSGFDLYAMDPDDVVKLAKLEEITSKVRDIEEETSYYLFAPKKKDYKKIISDTIFSKMISFRKISSLD